MVFTTFSSSKSIERRIVRPLAFALICALKLFVSLLVSLPVSAAESELIADQHMQVGLVSEVQSVVPGQPFWVALRLIPEQGWHTYWKNTGDSGLPTTIDWQLPQNSQASPISWPIPERIDYVGFINYGYHADTLLLTQITPPPQKTGNTFDITANADWLVCLDICIPQSAQLHLSLAWEDSQAPRIDSAWAEKFAATKERIPVAIDVAGAKFSVDEHFNFELPSDQLGIEGTDSIAFFPVTPERVVNTFEPQIERKDGALLVRVARDMDEPEIPEEFSVVLVLERAGKQQAYEFAASLSGQATAAQTLAPLSGSAGAGALAYFLLLALAGGVILNLMPCVFPVLSIKVISLIDSNDGATRKRLMHGLLYTLGVVLSFVAIAATLLAIRSTGETLGWGFQLQSPWFVAALVYLFFIMGLSLSGFVEIGASLTRAGNWFGGGSGPSASFFTGILATLVATPCTAPFMGVAMGYALTQPAAIALLVFATLGLGLALPFLLLTGIPRLGNLLPRPGRWMESLKQLLAFPLYLTVVWLLWVFNRQTDSNAQAALLIGLVLVSFALWLWRQAQQGKSKGALRKVAAAVVMLGAISIPFAISSAQNGGNKSLIVEQSWSPQAQQQALAQGKVVLVNMTADWCITCKVNERLVLGKTTAQQLFVDKQVTYLVGDWTNKNAEIAGFLEQFGRNGVPLYVLFKPGEPPQVLPQILTLSTLQDSLAGVRDKDA